MTHQTIKGRGYTVSSAAAGIIFYNGIALCSVKEGVQSYFIAPGESVTCSVASVIITLSFSHAVGGASSPSGAQSMPVVELGEDSDIALASGVMYRYALTASVDSIGWQGLSMESHPERVMTCELCIDARGYLAQHEVTWPLSWLWLDEQSAPDLSTGGLRYFAIRSDHGLTFIVEHTCYSDAQ